MIPDSTNKLPSFRFTAIQIRIIIIYGISDSTLSLIFQIRLIIYGISDSTHNRLGVFTLHHDNRCGDDQKLPNHQ